LITSRAFSEEQGNASTHPVNVSTKTRSKSNLEVGIPGSLPQDMCLISGSQGQAGRVVEIVVLANFTSPDILEGIFEFYAL
jgi:hypothetical protein